MIPFRELLDPFLDQLPPLSDFQVSRLGAHFELLLRWNKILNLSAIRAETEIVERHYCESLFLSARLPAGNLTIADLGSGAGFPGIPIAVLRPDCSVSLIESHQRKSVFLREAVRDLPNVRVLSQRAEEITASFDCVVSRAVNLPKMENWLVGHSQAIAVLSGADPISLLGFEWNVPLRLPWGDHRYLNQGVNVSRET